MNIISCEGELRGTMTRVLSCFCAVLLLALLSPSVDGAAECADQSTCAACIASPLACTWCYAANHTGARCLSQDQASSCPVDFENPTGNVTVLQNEPLSDTVQVQPQRVRINLRPGLPESFNLQVRPAGNFPLDVYFLMDFSGSMTDDLATVQSISSDIADTISSITTDFTLGFGSFIDKPVTPFFSASQLANRPLDRRYSFKHTVQLTSNRNTFIDAVNDERNSGNFDYPEGGFDGLIQAIVCTDVIGWRPNARHLLIYITDAGFHHAADGYLAGALTPNSGVCYMDNGTTPVYYDSDIAREYDFPSVSQIYSLLVREEIIPIFSCTSDFLPRYQGLVREIPGSSAAELTRDSSNLLSIIRNEYDRISSTVQLTFDSVPGLQVTLELTNCASPAMPDPTNPTVCTNVQEAQTVEYRVTLQITELTTAVRNLMSFPLRVVVFGTVEIDIGLVLNCGCSADSIANSTECSSAGTFDCGVCNCNTGRAGENCICTAANLGNTTCPNGPNGAVCSGNGQCVCAQCVCNRRSEEEFYFGSACECNNFNCPLNTEGVRCSGRGTCGCNGTCVCDLSLVSNQPYTGEICECSPDTDMCVNPADVTQSICHTVGTCECNRCSCNSGYQGDFCEICDSDSSCALQTCRPLSDNCLNCLLSISGGAVVMTGSTDCSENCPNITFVDAQPEATTSGGVDTFLCEADISDSVCSGANFFVPRQNADRGTIYVQNQPSRCSTQVPWWLVVVPLVIALLVIGILALIIIKLILVYLDYAEYKRFAKEAKGAHFGQSQNPLYEKASDEIQNPMYDQYMEGQSTMFNAGSVPGPEESTPL